MSLQYEGIVLTAPKQVVLQKRDKSVKTEQGTQSSVNAWEAHESKAQQTGRDENDSHSTHTLGNGSHLKLFTHACKDCHCQAKANGCREGIDN